MFSKSQNSARLVVSAAVGMANLILPGAGVEGGRFGLRPSSASASRYTAAQGGCAVPNRARISRRAAEGAVRTLLRWAGEDPRREGLRDTPHRVVDAYRDWFYGYQIDPDGYLRSHFENVGSYSEMFVLSD